MNILSKHLSLVVFGAAVSLASPLSAQTGSIASDRRVTINAKRPPAGAGERGDRREVFYITDSTATGSHIPVVYRRYQGRTTTQDSSFQVGSTYGTREIGLTGALGVKGALFTLDPAIGSAGR